MAVESGGVCEGRGESEDVPFSVKTHGEELGCVYLADQALAICYHILCLSRLLMEAKPTLVHSDCKSKLVSFQTVVRR